MRDRVADVLAQRATLDRGAGLGVLFSILFHAGLGALAVYGALHATPPKAASMVNIQLASMPAMAPPTAARTKPTAPKPVAPRIEEPKPRIEEPKPIIEKPAPQKPPEKNTVPVSPFGRSTKKGSEVPTPRATSNQQPATAAATATAPEVPIGGSGVMGLEGGDFPYPYYIQGMHKRIGANWVRPPVPAGTTVVIQFRILRDGTVTDARVESASGNPTFDRAALSAVLSSSPLNTLPFPYSGTFLGVHLAFR